MKIHEITESFNLGNVKFVMDTQSTRAGDSLVWINVAKLDEALQNDSDFYVGKNGAGGIKNRYARFGEFLKTGIPIEAAIVSVDKNGMASITNGRHRFAWFRDHSAKYLPVCMDDESIEYAKQFGYLK